MNSIMAPKQEIVNGPKVGDILVSTYGYEACIAHFAKVVAVTGKSIKIVRLGNNDTHRGHSGMDWESTPDLSRTSLPQTKRFKACGNSYSVKDTSFSTYFLWNGKPVTCYNYH